jgi:hypothetical protein
VQVPRCCWRRSSHAPPIVFWHPAKSQLASTFRSGFFLLLVD